LGTGEALVTALNEKGIPTPLAHVLMRSPESRMDVLTPDETNAVMQKSKLAAKYNQDIDRESAFEILNQKILDSRTEIEEKSASEKPQKSATKKEEPTAFEKLSKNTMVRQLGNTVLREVTRGLLGVLGVKKSSSKKRNSGFF